MHDDTASLVFLGDKQQLAKEQRTGPPTTPVRANRHTSYATETIDPSGSDQSAIPFANQDVTAKGIDTVIFELGGNALFFNENAITQCGQPGPLPAPIGSFDTKTGITHGFRYRPGEKHARRIPPDLL